MCTQPLKGFKYGVTKNGKDNYIIRPYNVDHLEVRPDGKIVSCLHPVGFTQGKTIREYIDIPCGKCLECRLDYSRKWSQRCFLESLEYENNCFITLTYDDDHIPEHYTQINHNTRLKSPYKTLRKKDFQDFMKRLRKAVGVPIRFYASGEYGSKTCRPHYHAIIFGWMPSDDDLVPVGKNGLGQLIYSSCLLSKIWDKGNNSVGECTPESCSYVARYVAKKVYNDRSDWLSENFGIEKEFVLMSRRPGIGANWFENNNDCYATFLRNSVPTKDGGLMITPNRYFDDLLERKDPGKLQEIKQVRKEFAKQKKLLEMSTTSLPYLDALKVKEENLKARTKILTVRKEI